jgi:uncharacterized GH25 family protein/5-hydroxyisourate hydrolase-like protein (transthyretin family)
LSVGMDECEVFQGNYKIPFIFLIFRNEFPRLESIIYGDPLVKRAEFAGKGAEKMKKAHLLHKSPFFLAMTILWALCAFIPATVRSEEKPKAAGKLKTLDEIVKTLPRFDISGQVVDKAGESITGAEVWLYYARGNNGLRDRLAGHAKTSESGTFIFEKAMLWEPQTEPKERHTPHYIITARHPDHGIYFTKLYEGDPADNVKIAITQNTFGDQHDKTRTITIVDEKGNPIPGVKVYLCGGRLLKSDQEKLDRKYHYIRFMQDLGIVSGLTDEQGKITLTLVNEANYWAEKEGYMRTWVPGEKGIMFKGAEVSGTVIYPDGTPADGAAVSYVYHGNRLVWDEVTVSDANGHYTFENVPASGFYYSWMNPEDEAGAQGNGGLVAIDLRLDSPLLSKKETFTIRPGDKLEKNLTFEEGVKLAGTVIDIATDKPVPRMQMQMLIETGQRYLDTKSAATDENGHFETSIAPGSNVRFSWEESRTEGDYLIDKQWRQQGNYQPSFRKTVTENEDDLVFKVKLVPIKSLSGQVVDKNGKGMANAVVYFHSEVPSTKADETGKFELKAVFAERDFDLYAESPDGSLAGLAHFKPGTTSATITLSPTRTFAGEVKNTEGLPAGNLKFYMDLKLNDDMNYRVRREPTTDEEGKFTVKNLCPQALYYAWWHSDHEDNRDYDYGNADIDLARLEPNEPIKFEAKQYLNTLMGKVVDDQGKPIAKASILITAYDMMPQNERRQQYNTDENGEFEISRLAPGKVELVITANGYLSKRCRAETDSFDFEAVLRPDTGQRSNRVKVVDDDDKPLPNIPVHLRISKREKDEREYQKEMIQAQTNVEGIVRFELQLDSDKYFYGGAMIECDIEGYDLACARANLKEELDLVLKVHKSDRHWQAQVLDMETGKPIEGATATVRGMRIENSGDYAFFEEEQGMEFRSDNQGHIQFARFSNKDGISASVLAPNYAKEQKWLSPERPEDNIFRLARAGIITGRVTRTDAGELPEGIRVLLEMTSGNRVMENLPVEKDGTFSCDYCQPGPYKLSARSSTEEGRKLICCSEYQVDVKTGQTVDVVIEMEKGIPVSGKMIDAATGKPPADREYAYVRTSDGQSYSPISEDGSWELFLPEGEHIIMYRCKEMNRQEEFKRIKLEKGKPVNDLVINVGAKSEQTPDKADG